MIVFLLRIRPLKKIPPRVSMIFSRQMSESQKIKIFLESRHINKSIFCNKKKPTISSIIHKNFDN